MKVVVVVCSLLLLNIDILSNLSILLLYQFKKKLLLYYIIIYIYIYRTLIKCKFKCYYIRQKETV